MARLVVAAAVGIVVGYFAGPQAGFQTFALVYGATGFLDPNAKVLGPKLNDLKAPSASYGSPIPYVEGAPRLAGVFFWASAKREIATTTTQGKGGPGVDSTTYTYEIDALIGLACNQCTGVRRVWSNGKLVWSNASDAADETALASAQSNSWRDMRFYSGAADQLPDATYEAAVGIGNAPAYRGRATVMLEGLNLGGSGQLPVLTFEVVSQGSLVYVTMPFCTFPLIAGQPPFVAGITAMNLGGFKVLYGLDYDTFDGQFTNYGVWDVASDGTVNAVHSIFPLPSLHGPAAQGNTDESCIVASEKPAFLGPITYYTAAFADGSYVRLPTEQNVSVRFSKVGNDIALVSPDAGGANDRKVRRYDRITGAIGARSVSLPLMQSIVIGGSHVFLLSDDGLSVYQLDLSTLAFQTSFATPGDSSTPSIQSSICCDENGAVVLFSIGWSTGATPHPRSIWTWNGTAWLLVAAAQTNLYATPGSRHANYARGGVLATQTFDSGTGNEKFYIATQRITIVQPALSDVVSRLCLRTGQLTAADIDVTGLSGPIVRAMAVSQVSTSRNGIETLMAAYLFECVEGQKLRFVLRGGAPVKTIPYDDLAAGSDGTAEPLARKRRNDVEVPALVTVRYANVMNDFQDGAESGDRLVTDSTAVAVIELPLGFTPAEAKKLADANTMDLAVSLLQIGPIALPRKYAELEPTDVILLTDRDGSTFRARIMKGTIGAGVSTFDLVLDDATVINSAAATDSDYAASTLVRILADTELRLLDIPILRDVDDGQGMYVAGKPRGNGRSSGFELDRSSDGTNYLKVLDSNARAVMGTAQTVLGPFSRPVFDEVNTVTVDVGVGELSSVSRASMLTSNANAMLLGSEIVQFRSAALLTPGVYVLSGLLRGRRGTEWANVGHVAGEQAVLLTTVTLRRAVDQTADLGVPYQWKAVTFGKSRATAAVVNATDTGVSLKPFSPVALRVAKSAGGDLSLSWLRRTRLATSFTGPAGSVVPLGEVSERYEVDVVNTGTGMQVRTASATSPAFIYSAAAQATDGVSSATNIQFRVYQMSEVVGRGYPGIASAIGGRSPQAEIATVTVGGIFAAGVPLFVRLGTTTVSYTATSGDANLAGVAASLGALIDALPVYAATVAGTTITITGAVSLPFSIQAGLVGAADLAPGLEQQAVAAGPAVAQEMVVGLIVPGGFAEAGESYSLRFERGVAPGLGDRSLTYTFLVGSRMDQATLTSNVISVSPTIAGLAGPDTIFWSYRSGLGSFPTATFPADGRGWVVSATTTRPGGVTPTAGITQAPQPARPVALPQKIVFFGSILSGTPVVGNIYRVVLGGTNYDYTVASGNTIANVVTGLVAAINGSASFTATDYSDPFAGARFRVTANAANTPFTYSGQLIPGPVTVTATVVQPAI